MSDKLIKAPFEGDLVIGDIKIPCYVLENKTRVLSQRGMQSTIGMSTGGGSKIGVRRLATLVQTFEPKKMNIKDLLARLNSPIIFQPTHGGRSAFGYEATVLTDLCEFMLKCRDDGLLKTDQQHYYAQTAELILRGLAQVGIIALVDEATGYQEFRARHALEEILERFIAKELRPWAKTFPDEFYEQMFRLRGWRYDPSTVKRPQVIGHLTNDLVYSRLAPGVLRELRKREPTDIKGRRKHQLHRWTTEDIGHPKLREHLASVITLMKVAPDKAWRKFMSMLNRALPKYGDTLALDLGESDEE